MYTGGMTTADIEAHIRHIYGIKVSDTMVSRITDKILPAAKEWQQRPLEQIYAVIFLDAIHHHVRSEGKIMKKAIYIAIGMDWDGRRVFSVCGWEKTRAPNSGRWCSTGSEIGAQRRFLLPVQTILPALPMPLRALIGSCARSPSQNRSSLRMTTRSKCCISGYDGHYEKVDGQTAGLECESCSDVCVPCRPDAPITSLEPDVKDQQAVAPPLTPPPLLPLRKGGRAEPAAPNQYFALSAPV